MPTILVQRRVARSYFRYHPVEWQGKLFWSFGDWKESDHDGPLPGIPLVVNDPGDMEAGPLWNVFNNHAISAEEAVFLSGGVPEPECWDWIRDHM